MSPRACQMASSDINGWTTRLASNWESVPAGLEPDESGDGRLTSRSGFGQVVGDSVALVAGERIASTSS